MLRGVLQLVLVRAMLVTAAVKSIVTVRTKPFISARDCIKTRGSALDSVSVNHPSSLVRTAGTMETFAASNDLLMTSNDL